jgi:3-oxoacyl-[acyl-carrier-protein] synthase III
MKIAAVQHVLPSLRITNDDIIAKVRRESISLSDAELDEVESRIRQFFRIAGTEQRFWARNGEKAIDMLLEAGRKALREASLEPEDIGLVMYTGVGRGWVEPAMANVVQHELGLRNAVAMDILDACESWLKAMQIAHSFLRTGVHRRIMIVNCEAAFDHVAQFNVQSVAEVEHLFATYTIGEAATATILTDEQPDDDFYFKFKTFGEHYELCMIPLPNFAEFMPGSFDERYRPGKFFSRSTELVATALQLIIETFLEDPRLRTEKYDLSFGHSASVKANQVFARKAGMLPENCFEVHQRFGNTVSASVPLALSVAVEEERLHRGDKVFVGVPSAGISIGFLSFTY